MSTSDAARALAPPGTHASAYDLEVTGRPRLVWYAAYGSNLCADRFNCYLAGGTPPGSRRTYLGCVNRTTPRQDVPVVLPGKLHFACTSTVWGGGIAFLDTSRPGRTLARAWLITGEQLEQVVAQENGWQASDAHYLPWAEVLTTGTVDIGVGLYGTICHLGELDGAPVLTMTARFALPDALQTDSTSTAIAGVPPAPTNRPSSAYLAMLGRGLEETFALGPDQMCDYLAEAPGADRYSAPALRATLARSA